MRNTQNEAVTSTPTRTTTPFELFGDIQEKNHALRAFGALLRSARLSDFDSGDYFKGSPGKHEAENMQWGLSKLIDLYLADQEQAIERYADEYSESDEWLISSASSTIKLFEEGMWNPGHIPMDRFSDALEGLETVIARNPTLSPMAEVLKASIIKHIPATMSHNVGKVGGSIMNSDFTNLEEQHPPVVFCGVDSLVRRLSALATQAENLHITNEINAVVAELCLLDNVLYRLRHERSLVDEKDIDLTIDRLRCVHQGEA